MFPIVYDRDNWAIANKLKSLNFVSKRNPYHPYIVLNYLRISRKLFSFYLINLQPPCFVHKMSVKCPETVVINLHMIGNTFVNIRIYGHTLHFHHSDWFQIVRDCWIYLYREQSDKISDQNGTGALKPRSNLADYFSHCLRKKKWAIANNMINVSVVKLSNTFVNLSELWQKILVHCSHYIVKSQAPLNRWLTVKEQWRGISKKETVRKWCKRPGNPLYKRTA